MPSRTQSQQAASRANGSQSHGPATPEGKARSSQNSIKHGLHSKSVVLPHEDRAAFERLRQSYFDRFQPADPLEAGLVDRLAAATWRLNRVIELDTRQLEIALFRGQDRPPSFVPNPTSEHHLAWGFQWSVANDNTFALMLRYETQYTRQFDRALKQLQALQNNRAQAPAPAPQQKLRNEPERRAAAAPARPSNPPPTGAVPCPPSPVPAIILNGEPNVTPSLPPRGPHR